mgnify:CR=1 FL=1
MSAAGKVCTGFSKPYVAKYNNTGGVVSYSGAMLLARGVSVSLSLNTTDDNTFYADNVAAEVAAATFSDGTATLTVDGLDIAVRGSGLLNVALWTDDGYAFSVQTNDGLDVGAMTALIRSVA